MSTKGRLSKKGKNLTCEWIYWRFTSTIRTGRACDIGCVHRHIAPIRNPTRRIASIFGGRGWHLGLWNRRLCLRPPGSKICTFKCFILHHDCFLKIKNLQFLKKNWEIKVLFEDKLAIPSLTEKKPIQSTFLYNNL